VLYRLAHRHSRPRPWHTTSTGWRRGSRADLWQGWLPEWEAGGENSVACANPPRFAKDLAVSQAVLLNSPIHNGHALGRIFIEVGVEGLADAVRDDGFVGGAEAMRVGVDACDGPVIRAPALLAGSKCAVRADVERVSCRSGFVALLCVPGVVLSKLGQVNGCAHVQ